MYKAPVGTNYIHNHNPGTGRTRSGRKKRSLNVRSGRKVDSSTDENSESFRVDGCRGDSEDEKFIPAPQRISLGRNMFVSELSITINGYGRCFQDASACREWIRLQQYEARQELSLEWKLVPRRRQQTEKLTKLLREMVDRPGLRSRKAMVWWSVLERCGHRSTEEEVDCYVPALRYKEMEGKPCVPVSSDVCKLRCNAWATKDSASNLHWPTGVASRQSGRVGGLYKEVQDRWEGRRAAHTC